VSRRQRREEGAEFEPLACPELNGAAVFREPASGAVLIIPPSPDRTLRWLAALGAAGIPYRVIELDGGSWCIRIQPECAGIALHELIEYERVNRNWPPRPHEISISDAADIAAGAVGVLLLCLWFLYTGPADNRLVEVAGMDSSAVINGQWWRCVTALTLHADVPHVLSNSVCLVVFATVLGARCGAGVTWALILSTGAYGNLIAAWIVHSPHRAIGASTAVFGALGILAVDQFVKHWRTYRDLRSIWSRAWVAVGSAVALLALLGTGLRADLAGHFFGFAVGCVAGAMPAALRRRPNGAVQAMLLFMTVATVLVCWGAALMSYAAGGAG